MKSAMLLWAICTLALTAGCRDAPRTPKEHISKYSNLFTRITHALKTNGFEEVYEWPWSATVTETSITNLQGGVDAKYYLTGSYSENDYIFMKVVIRHDTGNPDFACEWSQNTNRPAQLKQMETMVRAIAQDSGKD